MNISKNTENQSLFAFYLGGSHPKSNIELHNVQFAVGQKIEDCYDQLKKDWFGDQKGLHIDSYAKLDFVDGYKITVIKNITQKVDDKSELKLFCVHLGAAISGVFEEQHITRFTVAKTASEALLKIQKSVNNPELIGVHRDELFGVENIFDLSNIYNLGIENLDTNQTYQVVNLYKKI